MESIDKSPKWLTLNSRVILIDKVALDELYSQIRLADAWQCPVIFRKPQGDSITHRHRPQPQACILTRTVPDE